jgi:DNA primase
MELKDLRMLYDITDILSGLGVDTSRRYMICPMPHHIHHNNTPSFSVFVSPDGVQRFKCHGNCGLQGDAIDLAGYLWVGGYDPNNKEMIRLAVDALQARREMNLTPVVFEKPRGLDASIQYPLTGAAMAYAQHRGLNENTARLFSLGEDQGYLTIPNYENGKLISIKKRAMSSNLSPRYKVEKGSRKSLFNHDAVKYRNDVVFYVKAEIPAMLMTQMGYNACSPGMGENSFMESWKQALAFAKVIIIGDNDEAGIRAASTRAIDLGGVLKFPPDQYKDLDEWILDIGEERARVVLDRWVEEAQNA